MHFRKTLTINNGLRVLSISSDSAVCNSAGRFQQGHVRMRQRAYAKELQNQAGSASRLLILAPVFDPYQAQRQSDSYGLRVIPVYCPHRYLYPFLVIFPLLRLLKFYRPQCLTVQDPWEHGLLACFLKFFASMSIEFQIHGEIGAPAWNAQGLGFHMRFILARLFLPLADNIRVVNREMMKRLVSQWNIPENRISLIPVPVFMARPRYATHRAAKEAIHSGLSQNLIILFVGTFYKPKNLRLWLKVASEIAKKNEKVRFLLAGDGPEEEIIRQMCLELQLSDRMIFLGRKSRTELANIYAAADIFLLTSNHESYGLVVVEAMLSSIPVVSTATTGPSEIIQDGFTGFLAPIGSAEGLVDALQLLLKDQKLRERLGICGQKQITNSFAPEPITRLLVSRLCQLCHQVYSP